MLLGNKRQATLSVKGSIIHNDDGVRRKVCTKTTFKPLLKKLAVHGSFVLQRRYDFIAELCSYYTYTLISFARYTPDYFSASFRVSIFSLEICVDARFIHICNTAWVYISYPFEIP